MKAKIYFIGKSEGARKAPYEEGKNLLILHIHFIGYLLHKVSSSHFRPIIHS